MSHGVEKSFHKAGGQKQRLALAFRAGEIIVAGLTFSHGYSMAPESKGSMASKGFTCYPQLAMGRRGVYGGGFSR